MASAGVGIIQDHPALVAFFEELSYDEFLLARVVSLVQEYYWSSELTPLHTRSFLTEAATLLKARPALVRKLNSLIKTGEQINVVVDDADQEVALLVIKDFAWGEIHPISSSATASPSDITNTNKLRSILYSGDLDDAIMNLTRSWARCVMELLQIEISYGSEGSPYTMKCLRQLRSLSKKHGVLPPSFVIHDVTREGEFPVAGGGFADIWTGYINNQKVCLKVLRFFLNARPEYHQELVKKFCREALTWKNLNHPNVLPFIGVSGDLFHPTFCLISPWMDNGNLINFLAKHPQHDRLTAVIEIAEAIRYLHEYSPHIVHADIRGANILVSDDYHCRLADFGLSSVTESQGLTMSPQGINGASRWMAPELLTSGCSKPNLTPRDIYAFGCTMLEIYTEKPPFYEAKTDAAVIAEIVKGQRPNRPEFSSSGEPFPDALWDIIESCWAQDPDERPSAREVLMSLEQFIIQSPTSLPSYHSSPTDSLPSSSPSSLLSRSPFDSPFDSNPSDNPLTGSPKEEQDQHDNVAPLPSSLSPNCSNLAELSADRSLRTKSDTDTAEELRSPTNRPSGPHSRQDRAKRQQLKCYECSSSDHEIHLDISTVPRNLPSAVLTTSTMDVRTQKSRSPGQQVPQHWFRTWVGPRGEVRGDAKPSSSDQDRITKGPRNTDNPYSKTTPSPSSRQPRQPLQHTSSGTKPTSRPVLTVQIGTPSRRHAVTVPSSGSSNMPNSSATPTSACRTHSPSTSGPGAHTPRAFTERASSWAPRPPPNDVYERLEEFFPEHDLDKPLIEATCSGTSPIAALPPVPNSDNSHVKGRKSIRHVAEEHKRCTPIENLSSLASTVTRRRSTKLWGRKLEEVTAVQARGNRNTSEPDSPMGGSTTFKWVRGELIGVGTCGRVYLALNATTGELIAVKQVEVPHTASNNESTVVQALKLESEILKDLDHPNIVQYLGFEETPTNLSIFLEYVPGGSIGSCLLKHGKFDEEVTKSFSAQILDGLEYLHSKGILHRDLKADNILVEVSGVCKISDFGMSKRTKDTRASVGMQGTIFWMAPEILNPHRKGYNCKVDVWSVGCVVLEMWTGIRPWYGDDLVAVMSKLHQMKLPPPVPEDIVLSELGDDFRKKCFTFNPHERPTAAELRKHKYLELIPGWEFTGFK